MQPQPSGSATWTTAPSFPPHQRNASGGFEGERQEQYPQYNPMTYYPNQTLPGYRRPKPATPPATALPPVPSPTYYPRPDYQPASAPPQVQPYAYYPGYAYDYNEYPRQPSGSAAEPISPAYAYDPRQYRPQQFYPQQYPQWQYAPPSQPVPSLPKPEKAAKKRPAEKEPADKGKKKKVKKVQEPPDESLPKPPPKSLLNPPRQAQSAWQLFFADELNRAKAAAQATSPGGTAVKLNVAQVAKDAGTAYGNLDPERKAYYAAQVQESKEQYAREMLAWQATLTPEDIRLENAFRSQQRKDGKSRKGNLKDPHAPKKPLSAYFLFLKTIREDAELRSRVWGTEAETTKQSVLAAERWRGLSDVEKKPYLQRAEKDKADYELAKKLYEDDSAARARGEQVPERQHLDTTMPNVDLPESMKLHSPVFESPPHPAPTFESPQDPAYEQLAAFDELNHQEEWSDLHHLMEQHEKDKPDKEAFESMFLAE